MFMKRNILKKKKKRNSLVTRFIQAITHTHTHTIAYVPKSAEERPNDNKNCKIAQEKNIENRPAIYSMAQYLQP